MDYRYSTRMIPSMSHCNHFWPVEGWYTACRNKELCLHHLQNFYTDLNCKLELTWKSFKKVPNVDCWASGVKSLINRNRWWGVCISSRWRQAASIESQLIAIWYIWAMPKNFYSAVSNSKNFLPLTIRPCHTSLLNVVCFLIEGKSHNSFEMVLRWIDLGRAK